MSAQRLIRCFIGASIIASLAACSHTPAEQGQPATDAKDFVPDPVEVAKLRQTFLDKARNEAFEIEISTFNFYQETLKLKGLAEAGKITSTACALIDPPDALKQLQGIKNEYAAAVAKEVHLEGETEAGKTKRVAFMDKVLAQIESNRQFILKVCDYKFGV